MVEYMGLEIDSDLESNGNLENNFIQGSEAEEKEKAII